MEKSNDFELGACELETENYVLPFLATKDKIYACPRCDEVVILKKGEIKKPHFSHKPGNECNFYCGGESATHFNAK